MNFLGDYIAINGVLLPAPVSYEVQRSDLDSDQTTRNENGVLKRDRIRCGVYKIVASWRVHTNELEMLTNALSPSSFTVRFIDLTTCSYRTATMYAGDKSAKVVIGAEDINGIIVDYNCNLIEF